MENKSWNAYSLDSLPGDLLWPGYPSTKSPISFQEKFNAQISHCPSSDSPVLPFNFRHRRNNDILHFLVLATLFILCLFPHHPIHTSTPLWVVSLLKSLKITLLWYANYNSHHGYIGAIQGSVITVIGQLLRGKEK